jgi:hypothetical protein
LTKARLFAHLWHGGNETDAARDLIAASRDDPCTTAARALPQTVLAGIRDVAPAPVEQWRGGHVQNTIAATASELDSWISTFTANHHPTRLARRLEWMSTDPPTRLSAHARRLVSESIAGHYPASSAVAALIAALRHHGCHNPQAPQRLLSLALGIVLADLQPTLPDDLC